MAEKENKRKEPFSINGIDLKENDYKFLMELGQFLQLAVIPIDRSKQSRAIEEYVAVNAYVQQFWDDNFLDKKSEYYRYIAFMQSSYSISLRFLEEKEYHDSNIYAMTENGEIRELYIFSKFNSDDEKVFVDVIPVSIGRLHNIEAIGLYNVNLTSFPGSISNCTSMKFLCVGNVLDFGSLCNFPNLEYLTLFHFWGGNPRITSDISKLQKLRGLYIIDTCSIQIPNELMTCSKLEELAFCEANLHELPNNISKLANLRTLSITQGNLREIPSSITQLDFLSYLDLRNNAVQEIPIDIGNCRRMKTLKISHNHLQSIPASIENLASLNFLDLSENFIENLPDSIRGLKQLIELDVSHNSLTSFPENVENLYHLEKLDLCANSLEQIPASIKE
nr:leucine-rich repeat domain-containing protein [Candidatus Sigynarchaeota archaeon]